MSSTLAVKLASDPAAAARHAGLRYVSDDRPGIRRIVCGKGFTFRGPDGKLIRDPADLARIRRLAIPPAYTDVWISPYENGHIQATGRDDRGRKQYRYHPDWHHTRTTTKFHRMHHFGRMLPKIRRTVRQHLQLKGLPREKVLATVIHLLERTKIRIGNDEYAEQNSSYGLTTLKDRHARIAGSQVHFRFRGKSGKQREVCLEDPRLARVVRHCQDLPGQELFQYVDERGQVQDIDSADVNDYLREITAEDFTAKDFRTWAGTVLFVEALRRIEPCRSKTQAKRTLVQLVRQVAEDLGNTPIVCRKYYIHPFTIDSFLKGSIHELIDRVCEAHKGGSRISTEALVMKMLKRLSFEAVAEAAANGQGGTRPERASKRVSRPGTASNGRTRLNSVAASASRKDW